MKQTFFILVVVAFWNVIAFSQSNDSIINELNLKQKEIRSNLESYNLKEFVIYGESTEGTSVRACFSNEDLKYITVVWYGETGKRIVEYYFDDDMLFFAYNRLFEYNAPIYLDKETAQEEGYDEYYDYNKTIVKENRYYFENEILICWMDNDNKEIDLDLESSKEKEGDLISHSNKMKEKLK